MKPVKEVSLILFTLLGQATVGTCLFSWIFRQFHPGAIPTFSLRASIISMLLLLAAAVCSLFHLGHPAGSARSLANLKLSWLSREVISFGALTLFLVIDLVLLTLGKPIQIFSTAAAFCGILAIYTSARIYTNAGYPALNSLFPVLSFFLSVIVLGSAIFLILDLPDRFLFATVISLRTGLVISFAVQIFWPLIWLKKNLICRQTALMHFNSPYFWFRLILMFCVVILTFFNAAFLPILLLAGTALQEILGRVSFFNHMVHTSEYIGKTFRLHSTSSSSRL